MNNLNMKFNGYKSFQEEYATIEEFSRINVFIGRNNSGKSSCIDIIENITNPQCMFQNKFLKNGLDILFGHVLTEEDICYCFRKDKYSGGHNKVNDYEFGKQFIGKKIYFSVWPESQTRFSYEITPVNSPFPDGVSHLAIGLTRCPVNPWEGYKLKRLEAERDIMPELEKDDELVDNHGNGVSNLVRKYLNYSEYDERIVQEELLDALNKIIYPDASYDAIKIQQINENAAAVWEIFLQEGDNRFALSKMGSGLKTILLTLINLIIIPKTKEYRGSKLLFAFEELENNLHPALQRRLFDFLYEYSTQHNITMFLTTHSHVAINMFGDKQDAKLFHVERNAGVSTIHEITDYISKSLLLNDLDVRASDLLQANGIIWVEGPSDRVYIKRWIDEFCDGEIEEGRDYQFLYYGGKLLYHYTTEQDRDGLINILLTNRNSAIVIDSDKRKPNSQINDTKKRIKREFEKHNAFCWITKGKEIENYLEKEAIEAAYGKKVKCQCAQYELFPDYIKPFCSTYRKVEFAQKVSPYISKSTANKMLDLQKQIEGLCQIIKKWNMK